MGLVIEQNKIHTTILSIKQNQTFNCQSVDNQTFDYMYLMVDIKCLITVDSHTQSNIQLPIETPCNEWFLCLNINTDKKRSNEK